MRSDRLRPVPGGGGADQGPAPTVSHAASHAVSHAACSASVGESRDARTAG